MTRSKSAGRPLGRTPVPPSWSHVGRLTFGGVAAVAFVFATYVPQVMAFWSIFVPMFLAFAVPFIIAAAQLQAPWGFFAALLLPLAFAALDGLLRCMDVSGLWGLFQKVVLKDEAKLALHCGHLVAEAKVPPGDKKVDRALFTVLTKVLLENLAQSYLQAAFFGLSFASTKAPAKAKALGSLGLGLGASAAKLVPMAMNLVKRVKEADLTVEDAVKVLVLGLPLLFALIVVAWVPAKVYFSYVCESHMWNLLGGCVETQATSLAWSPTPFTPEETH
ncbi:dcd2A [Symbiodinium necroappetens]|uniref:Dcd2A protein n=1 Tax=Symbiodinium necroappetens TaxID=1628268 RepID=A0A812VPF9_9DINO|nr:dcd2A [Symbiodinium necroappetens]